MRINAFPALLLSLVGVAGGCRQQADAATDTLLAAREKKVEARIAAARRDTTGQLAPVAKWVLPDVLREVSGVAVTSDGRILAHNDERARVYVLHPSRGVIVKEFTVGERGLAGDFEAITVSGSDIFMMMSNGDVYQFREGKENDFVPFKRFDTKLGKECEFEGMAVEPGSGAFLLLCKVIGEKSKRDRVLIYRWLSQPGKAPVVSTISVPLSEAIGANGWKELSPSDLTIDPATGNYVLIAGRQKALVEITPSGSVVRSFPLPGNPQQPEGVAITRDGILIIGDEGVTRAADITLYPWRRDQGAAASNSTDSADVSRGDSTSAR